MFFKQVWRNVSRDRKGNSLFFGSLIVAIIAFYTLLSLDKQDVMIFLSKVESDAVKKLMMLIPVVYVVSLFFVFFLVFFACRYQIDNRRKEFGLYLMLGMKRSRLFAMLMCETLWSGMISVLIGLPSALLLTEVISLITARAVGIGIIEHRISFSADAVIWTVAGFIAVQLLSMIIICIKYAKVEPASLMRSDASEKQAHISKKQRGIFFGIGAIFLAAAYILGVLFLRNFDLTVLAVIFLGVSGTFMVYRGWGAVIGDRIRRKSYGATGLYTFTVRQLQENVLHQYKTLAIASLLILMALSCISYGIGSAAGAGSAATRSVDFSINGTQEKIEEVLNSEENKDIIETYYPMYLSSVDTRKYAMSVQNLIDALSKLPQTSTRDNIIDNFLNRTFDYAISETSFNSLRASMGKEPIMLGANEAAVYTSMGNEGSFGRILDDALEHGVYIELDGRKYDILPDLYCENVVADRYITLYAAMILPDEIFEAVANRKDEPYCWNVRLADDFTAKKGLMKAIETEEKILSAAGLEYESYLSGIGRNLFYTVAGSYLTIYLGVLFIIISNTVIGLKYLIQQRKNRHRYITLLMLGADTEELCRSSCSQIQMFFTMVLGVALCSSVFAIFAMFTSYLKLPSGSSEEKVFLLSAIAAILFIAAETVYINIVKSISCREIRALQVTDRG